MWDKTKRQRFSLLRERERQGALTQKSRRNCTDCIATLRKWRHLTFCLALNANDETEKLRAINEALRDVIRRKEEHLTRMQGTLAQFRTEREALNAELERILRRRLRPRLRVDPPCNGSVEALAAAL